MEERLTLSRVNKNYQIGTLCPLCKEDFSKDVYKLNNHMILCFLYITVDMDELHPKNRNREMHHSDSRHHHQSSSTSINNQSTSISTPPQPSPCSSSTTSTPTITSLKEDTYFDKDEEEENQDRSNNKRKRKTAQLGQLRTSNNNNNNHNNNNNTNKMVEPGGNKKIVYDIDSETDEKLTNIPKKRLDKSSFYTFENRKELHVLDNT